MMMWKQYDCIPRTFTSPFVQNERQTSSVEVPPDLLDSSMPSRTLCDLKSNKYEWYSVEKSHDRNLTPSRKAGHSSMFLDLPKCLLPALEGPSSRGSKKRQAGVQP
ncbi:uncharacterized protein PHA67_013207 isoform 2-T2 [Liasis olivaceus]